MDINSVLIRPLISEKSMKEVSNSRFTFRVAKEASKKNIKDAVEDKFKVHVLKVSTTIVKGRSVRAGMRRMEIAKSPWKKALVTLQKGEKIGLFELGGDKK